MLLIESNLSILPEGVVVAELGNAFKHSDLLQSLFPGSEAESGLFIYLPKNLVVKNPLYLEFREKRSFSQQYFIYLEEGAELSVFEEYVGLGSTQTHRLHLQKNAKLNYYKLQAETQESKHVAALTVDQQRDSEFKSMVVSLGGKISQDQWVIRLHEPNARCELNAFYHAQQKQSIEHHTTIEHLSERCNSQQNYKSIANDQGRTVFRGRVKVHPQAQKTMAAQMNQNLLLSSQAEVDAKPELEIYADDVKCSHGSTIGQLDQEALFYLRSRGLNGVDAEHLLTCAFAMNVLEEIKHPEIAERLKKAAIESLSNEAGCRSCQNE